MILEERSQNVGSGEHKIISMKLFSVGRRSEGSACLVLLVFHGCAEREVVIVVVTLIENTGTNCMFTASGTQMDPRWCLDRPLRSGHVCGFDIFRGSWDMRCPIHHFVAEAMDAAVIDFLSPLRSNVRSERVVLT